jgi:hypothetical protein
MYVLTLDLMNTLVDEVQHVSDGSKGHGREYHIVTFTIY